MKNLLPLLVFAAIVAFSACKKKDNTPTNTGQIMFVNGCTAPTATNLDGKVNNVAVSGATNIAYNKNPGYKTVNAVTGATISFGINGLGSTLVSGTENIVVNGHYSAFAGGINTSPSYVFTADDVTAPSSGKAKIRFVNLCYDNINVSCYLGAAKIDSNVSYKMVTPFYEVAAATGKVAMIDQTVLVNSAQITSQQLSAGKIYTFMLTGTTTATTAAAALTLTVINNN